MAFLNVKNLDIKKSCITVKKKKKKWGAVDFWNGGVLRLMMDIKFTLVALGLHLIYFPRMFK